MKKFLKPIFIVYNLRTLSNIPLNNTTNTLIDIKSVDCLEPDTTFIKAGNVAAFANHNKTLQKLIELGVDLSRYDLKKGIPEFIIKLDFEKDIGKYIVFLTNIGVPLNDMGKIFTRHPDLLKENLDDLLIRINYLKYMKFSNLNVAYIINKIPEILSMTTKDIDTKLGHIQELFKLKANEMRLAFLHSPRIINSNFDLLKLITLTFSRELGFKEDEISMIFKKFPSAFLVDRQTLVDTWDYLMDTMKVPRSLLLEWPNVLRTRLFILKNRHSYLASLGQDQYDPTRPLFVSLKALVSGTDEEFCTEVARTMVENYHTFLKTL